MKYLNINENRKDVDRYKFVVLFLLIVVLFGFLNIKSVKIYAIPYIFATTLLIVQVRYIIIETKEFARIGYNGFLFPHSYSGDRFTKVIVNRKSKITLKISLRARIRTFP